jgi:hypothetical protein
VAAARGDAVAWIEDQACGVTACPLHLTTITTGADRVVQPPPGSAGFLAGGAISPDGRFLAAHVLFPPESNVAPVIDVIDLRAATSILAGSAHARQDQTVVWTPDGAWVFFCGFPAPLYAFRPSDQKLFEVAAPEACPHLAVF